MQDLAICLDTEELWLCVAVDHIVSQFTSDVRVRYGDAFQKDPLPMRRVASK